MQPYTCKTPILIKTKSYCKSTECNGSSKINVQSRYADMLFNSDLILCHEVVKPSSTLSTMLSYKLIWAVPLLCRGIKSYFDLCNHEQHDHGKRLVRCLGIYDFLQFEIYK